MIFREDVTIGLEERWLDQISIKNILTKNLKSNLEKRARKIVIIIWQCVIWSISKCRNDATFKNLSPSMEKNSLKMICSWKWLTANFPSSIIYSTHEWCTDPMLCIQKKSLVELVEQMYCNRLSTSCNQNSGYKIFFDFFKKNDDNNHNMQFPTIT